jgi:hypothetical protein
VAVADLGEIEVEAPFDAAQRGEAGACVVGTGFTECSDHSTVRIAVLRKAGAEQSPICSSKTDDVHQASNRLTCDSPEAARAAGIM